MANRSLFITFFVNLICISIVYSASVEHKIQKVIQRRLDPIDPAGKFHIEYEVDFEKELIHFYIEVETKGFVGFGISNNGGMTGADIIIGGVFENGTHYFSDRHGVGNSEPLIDTKQDWVLNCISENATHTSLNVTRPLNTCDVDEDVVILGDTTKLIWSYGNTDEIKYQDNRGTYSVNLIDPPMPPFDESTADKWLIQPTAVMPKEHTTYWCSIHKTPDSYTQKRHVIGFNTKLEGDINIKHTHHFVVYKCHIDPTKNLTAEETFGRFVGKDGNPCFVPPGEDIVPINLCYSITYIWAVGGRMMTLPEDVGFPITEQGPEYFMVEMHYDNPAEEEGIRVVSTLEVYNTLNLRPVEAGIGVVMRDMTLSQVIPAQTESFLTVGHCGAPCTMDGIPPGGSTIFNVMLHSHKAGRGIKLRHFRGETELPWIGNDDNYDFDYQQNRPLREFVKVMPGDHLTVECRGNTMDRTHVTMTGPGTMQEMCQAIFWVYPLGSFPGCSSTYNDTKMLSRFGIQELEPWTNHDLDPPLVVKPDDMKGKTYSEVLGDVMKNWTAENFAEFQKELMDNDNHQMFCSNINNNPPVGYPKAEPYVPNDPCINPRSRSKNILTVVYPTEIVAPFCRAVDPNPDTTTIQPPDTTTPNTNSSSSIFGHFSFKLVLGVYLLLISAAN